VEQVTALVAHGCGPLQAGMCRQDPALTLWTIPAQLVVSVCALIAGDASRVPLVPLGWRARMVVGGLALTQSIAQGIAAISAVVAGVVALSYLTPWWLTGWYQHLDRCGDRFVADHGLGAALAGYLQGWPATPRTLTRIRALDPLDPPTATPRLVVVRPGG